MLWTSRYRVPMRPANAWWNEMRRLNRQMDYLFGGTRGPIRNEYPLINAWAGDDGLKISAELPGVNVDDLDISIDGRTLTLSGVRQPEDVAEDARHYRHERSSGQFTRTVELPFDVEVDSVQATYEGGILGLTLPRLPEEKPRTITVHVD